MLRSLLCVCAVTLTLACAPADEDVGTSADPTASESEGESGADDSDASSESTESTEETGEECTDEDCQSQFVVTLTHALDLSAGPYQLLINTPTFELICSIGPDAMGDDSCFGNAYVDIAWTDTLATVTLLEPPWFDAIVNPEALPDESAEIVLNLDGQTLYEQMHDIDAGDPIQPDPCGAVCWHAGIELQIDL